MGVHCQDCLEGDVVLDCFAGTGTTVMACINTGRRFVAFEKNPTWHSSIKKELYSQ